MNNSQPQMHCHQEFLADTGYSTFIPEETIMKWFNDHYSTSKHLLVLYSIAIGLKARNILEIGFGRSTFVLAKAAAVNQGRLVSCDTRDFGYLLNDNEKQVVTLVNGYSKNIWKSFGKNSFDFVFLDYFSSEKLSTVFILKELLNCIHRTKPSGIITIHDVSVKKYKIGKLLGWLPMLSFLLLFKKVRISILPYNYGLAIIHVGNRHIADHDPWVKKEDI
jgi:hypothetical protein